MSVVFTLLLGLLVVFLITVATGYFVAQEFAYMTVDRSRLKARAEAGDAFHELVRVGVFHLDVEGVDVGEALEQHRLAFHHRL